MLNVQTVAVATVSLVPVYVPLVTLVLHANAVFARMTAMVMASAKPKSNWLMIIPTTPTMPHICEAPIKFVLSPARKDLQELPHHNGRIWHKKVPNSGMWWINQKGSDGHGMSLKARPCSAYIGS